jgi:hypothetical protein
MKTPTTDMIPATAFLVYRFRVRGLPLRRGALVINEVCYDNSTAR